MCIERILYIKTPFSILGTNTISRIITKVHEGPIFTLCVLKEGSVVSGGGKDGIIKQLDPDLQPSGYETRVSVKALICSLIIVPK